MPWESAPSPYKDMNRDLLQEKHTQPELPHVGFLHEQQHDHLTKMQIIEWHNHVCTTLVVLKYIDFIGSIPLHRGSLAEKNTKDMVDSF